MSVRDLFKLQALMEDELPDTPYKYNKDFLHAVGMVFTRLYLTPSDETRQLLVKLLADVKTIDGTQAQPLEKMSVLLQKLETDPLYQANEHTQKLAELLRCSHHVAIISVADIESATHVTHHKQEAKSWQKRFLSTALSTAALVGYSGMHFKTGRDINDARIESTKLLDELQPHLTDGVKILTQKTKTSPISANKQDNPVQYLLDRLLELKDGKIETTSPLSDKDKEELAEHIKTLEAYRYHEERSLRSPRSHCIAGALFAAGSVVTAMLALMNAAIFLVQKSKNNEVQERIDNAVCAELALMPDRYHSLSPETTAPAAARH